MNILKKYKIEADPEVEGIEYKFPKLTGQTTITVPPTLETKKEMDNYINRWKNNGRL